MLPECNTDSNRTLIEDRVRLLRNNLSSGTKLVFTCSVAYTNHCRISVCATCSHGADHRTHACRELRLAFGRVIHACTAEPVKRAHKRGRALVSPRSSCSPCQLRRCMLCRWPLLVVACQIRGLQSHSRQKSR